jgi:hypothetical protein
MSMNILHNIYLFIYIYIDLLIEEWNKNAKKKKSWWCISDKIRDFILLEW